MKRLVLVVCSILIVSGFAYSEDIKPFRIEAALGHGLEVTGEYAFPISAVSLGLKAGVCFQRDIGYTGSVHLYPFSSLGRWLYAKAGYYYSNDEVGDVHSYETGIGCRANFLKILTAHLEVYAWHTPRPEETSFNVALGLGFAF